MKEICRSPRRTLVGDRNQHERVRAHSHEHIVNNIVPQMAEFDLSYHPSNMKSVNSDNRELYVDIEHHYEIGRLESTPKESVRYFHQDYDDENYLASFAGHESPPYPAEG